MGKKKTLKDMAGDFDPRAALKMAASQEELPVTYYAPDEPDDVVCANWSEYLHEQRGGVYEAVSRSSSRRYMSSSIRRGRLVVNLPVSLVVTSGGEIDDDQALDDLVNSIRAHGQLDPIRVHPHDPAWRPTFRARMYVHDIPEDTGTTFVLESGRRRLEACRRLGITVRALMRPSMTDEEG